MDINKWLSHDFNMSRTKHDYLEFEREYRALILERTKKLGYELISFNPHNYCFTAVIQSQTTKRYYSISISDLRFFREDWYKKVLWKEVSSPTDIVGSDTQRSPLLSLFDNICEHDKKKPNN